MWWLGPEFDRVRAGFRVEDLVWPSWSVRSRLSDCDRAMKAGLEWRWRSSEVGDRVEDMIEEELGRWLCTGVESKCRGLVGSNVRGPK